MLTADHGGAGVRRGLVLTNQVTLPDTAATLAWLFGFRLPMNASGQPVREAFQ